MHFTDVIFFLYSSFVPWARIGSPVAKNTRPRKAHWVLIFRIECRQCGISITVVVDGYLSGLFDNGTFFATHNSATFDSARKVDCR